jgi:hypothetical protein
MIPDTPDPGILDNNNIEYSYIIEHQQDATCDLVKTSNINSFNIINHNMELDNKIKFNNNKCSICLDTINGQDDIYILDCYHFFHNKCTLDYRKVNDSCPTCRLKYKNFVYYNSLKDLFYSSILRCKNKNCFYIITLEQAEKLNKIADNINPGIHSISKKSIAKIKKIIIEDIKNTFTYEDSFTENIPSLQNFIKKFKISLKNETSNKLNAFFHDYSKHYYCPYPLCHFYNQEAVGFLKNNHKMIIPIIKKIFISNLNGRESITECNFNKSSDSIIAIVNNNTFTYINKNDCIDGNNLFLHIIKNCIADSLLLKLKIENSTLFNNSKNCYIKNWDTDANKMNIVNNGIDVSIPINSFIDYESNKLDNHKFKTYIIDAQIDYLTLYTPLQNTATTNNLPSAPTQETINFHPLCTLTITKERGCVTLSYRIIAPFTETQLSWNFSLNFNTPN